MKILVLEDDQEWAERITSVLEEQGWSVSITADDAEAENELMAPGALWSLLVVDRHLGDDRPEGLGLVRRLRARGVQIPVLVLSLLGADRQRVDGLTAGANDYLVKPFYGAELVARVRNLTGSSAAWDVNVAGHVMRIGTRSINLDGEEIRMPPKLIATLSALAAAGGEPVSRDQLWRDVWPEYRNLLPQDTVIEAAIFRLRRHLKEAAGKDLIQAVRARGYRLAMADVA